MSALECETYYAIDAAGLRYLRAVADRLARGHQIPTAGLRDIARIIRLVCDQVERKPAADCPMCDGYVIPGHSCLLAGGDQ